MSMDLREQKFGIEIELTGLTRKRAAEVIGKYLGQEPHYDGGYYEEYSVRDEQGRKWKVIIEDDASGKKGGRRAGMDRKLARKIRQKKIAQGHARDDKEEMVQTQ